MFLNPPPNRVKCPYCSCTLLLSDAYKFNNAHCFFIEISCNCHEILIHIMESASENV